LRVENKAGVLVRIAGLFARRGFNIFSLAVAPTDDERFSRVVAVVDVESSPLQQILDQLDKLVNVVEISELDPADAIEAELLLATVNAGPDGHDELARLAQSHGARIVESSPAKATVMLAGSPDSLDQLEDELASLGIVELQRSGRIALPKLG
jgi:acetolactate synthase-1/3 small subunit